MSFERFHFEPLAVLAALRPMGRLAVTGHPLHLGRASIDVRRAHRRAARRADRRSRNLSASTPIASGSPRREHRRERRCGVDDGVRFSSCFAGSVVRPRARLGTRVRSVNARIVPPHDPRSGMRDGSRSLGLRWHTGAELGRGREELREQRGLRRRRLLQRPRALRGLGLCRDPGLSRFSAVRRSRRAMHDDLRPNGGCGR